jgi:hypothetical protein
MSAKDLRKSSSPIAWGLHWVEGASKFTVDWFVKLTNVVEALHD